MIGILACLYKCLKKRKESQLELVNRVAWRFVENEDDDNEEVYEIPQSQIPRL